MVALTISPKNGNHARYFPHSGYLGLTPVVVTGVVETRLEEDNQPIQASRLVVRIRCYEAIGSSFSKGIRPEQQQQTKQQPQHQNKTCTGASSSTSCPGASTVKNGTQFSNVNVLWQTEKTLWTAASHPRNGHDDDDDAVDGQYGPLGDWKGSWKLVVPVDAVSSNHTLPDLPPSSHHANNHNHSDHVQTTGCAVGSITYKAWRSWWLVETVIHHKPAGVLGTKIIKSHGLYLVNHAEAQKHYSRSIEDSKTKIQSTTRMTNRSLRYSIVAPSSVCCGDEVEFVIRIGSSSPHHHFNPLRPDRTAPGAPSCGQYSPLDQHDLTRLPEVHRSTNQGRVKDSADGSNRSDITLKRLQVSLVRRLAVELVKTPTSTSNTHRSCHQMDDVQARRMANPAPNPALVPPATNSTSSHESVGAIGSTKNSNNSKIQLTTYNTLATNTEGISKSNVLFNLSNHLSARPASASSSSSCLLPPHLIQEGYDLGFIVKLKIPIVKSKSHYSIGESLRTHSTTVDFFFQFKLSIKNKVTNRIEVVELSELSVQVFSISKEQLKSALDQLSKLHVSDSSDGLVYQHRLLLNPLSSSDNKYSHRKNISSSSNNNIDNR